MSKISPANMTSKEMIIGVDIGGTGVQAGLFEIQKAGIVPKPVWTRNQATEKGLGNHVEQIIDMLHKAEIAATTDGAKIIAVGVGSPGRFREDGTIKPLTATNLGITVDEFDNVNLLEEYQKALKEKDSSFVNIPMLVKNDGNAMLAGMLKSIKVGRGEELKDQNGEKVSDFTLRGKHVGLIGLGTGLGHAIAKISKDGSYEFVTDGHASKLKIPVDPEDIEIYKAAGERLSKKTGKDEFLSFDDNTVRAEDLYRAPVMGELCGVEDGRDIDVDNNPQHRKMFEMMGKYLGRTMAIIRSGQNTDIAPEQGWSEVDKAEAARTSLYLFGGGVGRSRDGEYLIKYAAEELKRMGINDIQMTRLPEKNVANRAAANMAFEGLGLDKRGADRVK